MSRDLKYLLARGHRFSGRIDKIVTIDDRLYIVDFKTTKTALSDYYFKGFMPNNQIFAYIWACREVLKLPVDGAIIDGVQTGVNFTRFARQVFNVQKELLDEWYEDTIHHLDISDVYANSGTTPQTLLLVIIMVVANLERLVHIQVIKERCSLKKISDKNFTQT